MSDDAVKARMVAAWRDPEVSTGDFRERFRLSNEQTQALRVELGPKAKTGLVSPLRRQDTRRRLLRRAAR